MNFSLEGGAAIRDTVFLIADHPAQDSRRRNDHADILLGDGCINMPEALEARMDRLLISGRTQLHPAKRFHLNDVAGHDS